MCIDIDPPPPNGGLYAGRLTRESGRASVDMQMGFFIFFYLCLLYLYLVPPQRAGIVLAVTTRVPSRTNNSKNK